MQQTPGSISRKSAERPLVVSVDIGSSSIRAAVHDRHGRIVRGTMVQVPYEWTLGRGGSVRLSHSKLLGLVDQALDTITDNAGSLASGITSGGISCFFHSITGLDAGGAPVTPVLSWADTTSSGQAALLRSTIDSEAMHALTGAPIHASYWPARIRNLRLEYPNAKKWVGFPELLAGHLAGDRVVSRSMASGTGLLDRASGEWSHVMLNALGVDPTDLPQIVNDDQPIGPLTGSTAKRWESLAGVTWYAPWGDGACNNVGLATRCPGTAALTVGTSGSLRALVDDPAPSITSSLFGFRLGKGSVLGGQLSEGGGVLSWAGTLLGRSTNALEQSATGMEPDSHGLTVLPFIFGERGPGYHDDARGGIYGLTPDTDPAAFYRAFIESIAYSFAAIDDELALVLGAPPSITASGGAVARSPLLVQTIADALGRDIGVAPFLEASLRGAALLALQGSGSLDPVDTIPPPASETIHHNSSRTGEHRAARERRAALYGAILGSTDSPGTRIGA